MTGNCYFDNAATSYPKPAAVAAEMARYLNEIGGTYGRSSHGRAFEASRKVEELRDAVASLLGTSSAGHVAFTPNATAALNLVLFGFLRGGETVYTTALEHNATTRPLHALTKSRSITVKTLPSLEDGTTDVGRLQQVAQDKPAMIVVNHASNVNGVIQPVEEIRRRLPDVFLLVDAGQSLGSIEIQVDAWNIDAIAWTGHKALLGPTGTGGLFIRNPEFIPSMVFGGTGSNSEDYAMPDFVPDRYEAGTPNIAGLFGLAAALQHKPSGRHSPDDWLKFLNGLRDFAGIRVLASLNPSRQSSIVSIEHDRLAPSEIGDLLWAEYGIAVRAGLHCAAKAHTHLGTYPSGSVRFSASPYHTSRDFDYALNAIGNICVN